MIETATMTSPIGEIEVAAHDGRLVTVEFGPRRRPAAEVAVELTGDAEVRAAPNGHDPAGAIDALAAYFEGDVDATRHVPVEFHGTEFQRSVWEALRTIPAGTTWSYGDLARAVGRPRAVRAVGQANGANPVGLVVPCHRVIRTGGAIGGYGGGLPIKEWLLRHEQVPHFMVPA